MLAWPARIFLLLSAALLVVAPPLFETGYYWDFYIPAAEIFSAVVAVDVIIEAAQWIRTWRRSWL